MTTESEIRPPLPVDWRERFKFNSLGGLWECELCGANVVTGAARSQESEGWPGESVFSILKAHRAGLVCKSGRPHHDLLSEGWQDVSSVYRNWAAELGFPVAIGEVVQLTAEKTTVPAWAARIILATKHGKHKHECLPVAMRKLILRKLARLDERGDEFRAAMTVLEVAGMEALYAYLRAPKQGCSIPKKRHA